MPLAAAVPFDWRPYNERVAAHAVGRSQVPEASMRAASNERIADNLREMANVLALQHDDGFRIAAYRRAAKTVMALDQPVEQLFREAGLDAVMELPGIGRGIASAISEMVTSGRWGQLDRLTGQLDPEALFQTVPGIGPGLANRIHDELHIDTLEQLEQSAHDGRLEQLHGVGGRRAAALKAALADCLGHRHVRPMAGAGVPAIVMLLDVDREYRDKAAAGRLHTIAPKRFNPAGEAWLPVLHTKRGDWHFTALFSNTQRAHELRKTRDWVVVYFHREGEAEAQATVVSETRGPLVGNRVVRGREGECIAHYADNKGE